MGWDRNWTAQSSFKDFSHKIYTPVINRKPYTCETCGLKFNDQHHLKRHEFLHTGKKPYLCTYCTLTFKLQHHLKRHENVHISKGHEIKQNPSEMVHFCRYCKKDFIGPEVFKTHEKEHKFNGEMIKCKFCGKEFVDVWKFTKHEKIHIDKPYECNYCTMKFNFQTGLQRHEQAHITKGSIQTVVEFLCATDHYQPILGGKRS